MQQNVGADDTLNTPFDADAVYLFQMETECKGRYSNTPNEIEVFLFFESQGKTS